jgi:hypothetical protein
MNLPRSTCNSPRKILHDAAYRRVSGALRLVACRSSKVHTGCGCRQEIRPLHAITSTLGPLRPHPRGIQKPLNASEKGDQIARSETVRNRHLRCRHPSVPVMQTANSLLCADGANYIWPRFGRPSSRRLLIQSEMSSVVVIIPNIFEAEPNQMSLVQRDHMI